MYYRHCSSKSSFWSAYLFKMGAILKIISSWITWPMTSLRERSVWFKMADNSSTAARPSVEAVQNSIETGDLVLECDSGGSSISEDSNTESLVEGVAGMGLEPYRFEPLVSSSSSSDGGEDQDDSNSSISDNNRMDNSQ